jgi:hypothetical protein
MPSKHQLIFVLGMGRSGTSAITRVLSLCGAALPEPLLCPNEGNPAGYWEPADGLKLNDAFLERHGSNWYDPRLAPPEPTAIDSSEGRPFVENIAAFLNRYVTEPLLVIKEPRITALTDFWFSAARRQGFSIAVVVAVRHPAEVGASLATRDGVPIELANTLWLKYNGLAEMSTRDIPRVFVEYPNFLTDWTTEVDRIAGALRIDLSARKEREINAFLSADLRHNRAETDERDPKRTEVERVYAMLSLAARDVSFSGIEVQNLVAAHKLSSEALKAVQQFAGRFSPTFSAALGPKVC